MPLVELEDAEIDFPDGMDGREVQGILDSIVGDFQEDLRRTGIKTSEYLGRLADNSVIISTIQGMRPEDRTALLTSMIPGVGDVAGTYADYTDIKKNFSDAPWHTKAAMVGGTLLGILPLFPSRTQVKAAAESLGAGYDAAWFKRQSDVGTAIFNEDAFEISKAAREKIKLYRGESPQVSDPRSPWWTEDIGRAESYGDVRSIEVDPEKRLVLDRFTGRSGNITDTEVNPDGMRELRRILGDEKTNRLDKGEFAHSVLDDADYAKIKESGYDSVVFGDDEGIQDYIIGGGPPRKVKAFHGSPHEKKALERMGDAKEQGFFTDMPLYHGTGNDFPEFDLNQAGATTGSPVARLGVSAALDPETANEFARQAVHQGAGDHANVLKLYHRAEKPGVIELVGNEDQLEIAATVEDSWDKGFDAIKFNNYTTPDGRKGVSFILVKNPEQLRSVNAQFDPKKKDSANLLASLAGGGILTAVIGSGEDEDATDKYQEI